MSKAKLRVCASCEWIFSLNEMCPKCGFGHYSARYVYGNTCYRLRVTQEPWFKKQQGENAGKLMKEISETSEFSRC